jgi:uncharacterized membrane protein SirB2
MSAYRPKSKFEEYFSLIGNALYYGCLLLAGIFIIGYALYQLFTGNFAWFKENGFVDFAIIIILAIVFGVLYTNKKDKEKEK